MADTDRELLREEHLKQVEDHLEMAVRKARQAGITREEILEILDMLFEEV